MAPGIVKKEVCFFAAPVPDLMTNLADYLPKGCHAVLHVVAPSSEGAMLELLRGTIELTGDQDIGLKAARMIEIGDYGALGDLVLLGGVRKFPQRVKCAMLAWRAFEQALHEPGATVTTEAE